MKKKGALGRGLDALLAGQDYDEQEGANERARPEDNVVSPMAEIPLAAIETNPYQPRTEFDEAALEDLAASIKAQGLIQPITVRRLGEGAYQLIAGERRTIAARRAGLETIPAFVRAADDEQMLEFALIENIQREDLNALEIAIGYKRLMEECSLTLEQVGEKVGKNRATVNNYLRLLRLPPEIQTGLRERGISMGHARALLGEENPILQLEFYNEVLEEGLSVRQTEELVRGDKIVMPENPKPAPEPPSPEYRRQIATLERSLSTRFNTRARISANAEGKGEIRLSFFDEDDLNRLLALLEG